MGSFKRNLSLVLGLAAGAAITVFAVSKSGQREIKRIGSKTAELRAEFLSATARDLTKIKRESKHFI